MYRPPEMTDIYQRYKVDEKVDIWMLGCVLYTMCFYVHPFQDASKLAIVQASFKIPSQRVTFRISFKIVFGKNDRFDSHPFDAKPLREADHL
jgi:serine/threonine protein kinase